MTQKQLAGAKFTLNLLEEFADRVAVTDRKLHYVYGAFGSPPDDSWLAIIEASRMLSALVRHLAADEENRFACMVDEQGAER